MGWEWREQNREKVLECLKTGEYEAILTSKEGALDALAYVAYELGVLDAATKIQVNRAREGIPDDLLLRTLAVLPFIEAMSLSVAAETLFEDAAILLKLGYTAVQIREGFNQRRGADYERKSEQSFPYHPEVLRQELQKIDLESLAEFRRTCIGTLFERGLVKGKTYAIDGSGLGGGLYLVGLMAVHRERPLWVNWRVIHANQSEKGKEATVTLAMVDEVREIAGEAALEWLLMDGLYADGPLLARLKYGRGIDALVRLPEERRLYAQLQGLLRVDPTQWHEHLDTRYVAGQKQTRQMRVAGMDDLDDWDSFVETAHDELAIDTPTLSAYAIASYPLDAPDEKEAWALVSTAPFNSPWKAYTSWRDRWCIENCGFREVKEGWHLEKALWTFWDLTVATARVTFTLMAYNVAQIAKTKAGERLAKLGIRRLRKEINRAFGSVPIIVFAQDAYAVLHIEELVEILGGFPPQFSFRKTPPSDLAGGGGMLS